MTLSGHISAKENAKKSHPLIMVEMVFPNTTNHYGTMFGGKVLDLMDRAAFMAATRFTEKAMVTASTERIDFFKPIKNGHMVELRAYVIFTGRTSLTVKVDLFSENPLKGFREKASTGFFHMVAVDETGKTVPIPSLLVTTQEEQEDWALAKKFRDEHLKLKHTAPL